jgi:hypothetical protein
VRAEVPVEEHYRLIKEAYENPTGGDSVQLLQTVLSVAERVGLDNALAYLEGCVVEKRLSWLENNLEGLERTGDHRPVQEFLSKLHPGLRFDRNYEALRPHTPYCEEIITLDEV